MIILDKNIDENHHELTKLIHKSVLDVDENYRIIISDIDYGGFEIGNKISFRSTDKYIALSSKFNNKSKLFLHLKDTIRLFFKNRKRDEFSALPYIYIFDSVDSAIMAINLYDKVMKEQNNTKEESVFKAVSPKYKLADVILNKNVEYDITSALSIIKYRNKIYDEWGFSKIDTKPKLILNFFGLPGTGKTMAAHAVSDSLNKNILLINYSEIESKYVGDAPKNLMKAFDEANRSNAVLFFDEADSFLGKRVENVTSSSDQSVNSLRSQMLILLEDFEGVVLFATNLIKNYDQAFESRILKHIKFELPNFDNRIKIISLMIPEKTPLKFNDFTKEQLISNLSRESEGLSGRELKNVILEALTFAAFDQVDTISEEYFLNALEKFKNRKKQIEKEKLRKKLPPEFKKKIEDKIKELHK